jgi:hypothetical protein
MGGEYINFLSWDVFFHDCFRMSRGDCRLFALPSKTGGQNTMVKFQVTGEGSNVRLNSDRFFGSMRLNQFFQSDNREDFQHAGIGVYDRELSAEFFYLT